MKYRMRRFLLFITFPVAALCGQALQTPRLATPQLGAVRLADSSIHRVYGVVGNFVLGDPLLTSAHSASFSSSSGLVAFSDRILLLDRNMATLATQPIEGNAITSVTAGANTAIAWISDKSVLWFWTGSAFASVAVQNLPSGMVLSVRRTGVQATLLYADKTATVSLETGNLIDCREVSDATLASVEKATGVNSPDLVIEQMNDLYVHVSSHSDNRTWVIRADGLGRAWELPAAKEAK